MKTTCEAYQAGDTMLCGRCGLQWDVNDTDPPRCGKQGVGVRTDNAAALRRRFELLAVKERMSVAKDSSNEYYSAESRAAWKFFRIAHDITRRDYAAA